MGFLSNMILDILYAPAVKADTRRAQEMYRESHRKMVAQWAKEAREEDCWYTGSDIVAPNYGYWSDGSIKVDGWTKDFYPKGLYYLDSQGHNAVLRDVPPGAKRCPTRLEQLRQDCEKRGIPFPDAGSSNPPTIATPTHPNLTVDENLKKYLPDGLSVIECKGDMVLFSYGGETVWEKLADDTRVEFVRAVVRAMYKLFTLNGETERAKEWKDRG